MRTKIRQRFTSTPTMRARSRRCFRGRGRLAVAAISWLLLPACGDDLPLTSFPDNDAGSLSPGPDAGLRDAGIWSAELDAAGGSSVTGGDSGGNPNASEPASNVQSKEPQGDKCAAVQCAAPGVCQAAGQCEPSTGECVYAALSDGTSCDDGDLCSTGNSCQAGVCTAGSPTRCTAVDQCHSAGVCDPQTGLCSAPAVGNGTECDDGDLCSSSDSCQSGVCTAGEIVTCTALDQCHTAGVCDPQSGQCSQPSIADNTSCNDGDLCSLGESCQSGVCTAQSVVSCTALDQCHQGGSCNPQTGQCSQPLAANDTSCNDGDVCTIADTCQLGLCAGSVLGPCDAPGLTFDWDSVAGVNYSHLSRLDPSVPSAFTTVGSIEMESWAVEDYGRAGDARFFDSHDHIGDECPAGTDCGNNTASENQHAFESMVQGFVVSLVGGGNFDLVSIDYRIRDDSQVNTDGERPHVNTVPGVDTSRVELWLSTTVDITVPPSSPFTAIDVGPASPAMVRFSTQTFTNFRNVSEVFVTSTGNVAFDNLVLIPRGGE